MSLKGKIVVGSAVEGTIFLVDNNDNPVSVSRYDSGSLVFRNSSGTETTVTLTIPSVNQELGQIPYSISAAESANADKSWSNADLLLVDDSDTFIFPLTNSFEIINRNIS